MKYFNITGLCVPWKHYMVDISGKIAEIMKLIERESYFTMNRGRQYGKTTTLFALHNTLLGEYVPISISFEGVGDESFSSEEKFCYMFITLIVKALEFAEVEKNYIDAWAGADAPDFISLGSHITKMSKSKKLVLMIDEVDSSSNNSLFLRFLGLLRNKFLARGSGRDFTFHSVILAGVTDIRNLKAKISSEESSFAVGEDKKLYNSPWNIAVSFDVNMSFNSNEIASMLLEYEADHNTGMHIESISGEIYSFTSGYPALVSGLCKFIDESLEKNWSIKGVHEAVKMLIYRHNMLLDDLGKNIANHQSLYKLLYSILIIGERIKYVPTTPEFMLASMYGYLRGDENENAIVSNRIFEIFLCDYFNSRDEYAQKINTRSHYVLTRDVVADGRFDMELCLRKFAGHYAELFSKQDEEFFERHCRVLFLSYIIPLINGKGFYHLESQFTDTRRMDLVVDFGQDQFIIELKIWRGETAQEKAYDQLLGYMDSKKAQCGYLVTFDFRKEQNKIRKAEWVDIGSKRIFDVIV